MNHTLLTTCWFRIIFRIINANIYILNTFIMYLTKMPEIEEFSVSEPKYFRLLEMSVWVLTNLWVGVSFHFQQHLTFNVVSFYRFELTLILHKTYSMFIRQCTSNKTTMKYTPVFLGYITSFLFTNRHA